MSVLIERRLMCDGCDIVLDPMVGTAAEERAGLRDTDGWSYRGGKDYCDACTAKNADSKSLPEKDHG